MIEQLKGKERYTIGGKYAALRDADCQKPLWKFGYFEKISESRVRD